MDIKSVEARSMNMSHIRGKDTTIETEVRRYLFSKGFRFRKNDKRYPGHPDIVLPKYKTVIFVNGCFWHRHPGCKYAYTPKSNIEFWEKKFEKNVSNDKRDKELLENMGWHVIIVWECELKTEERRKQRLERLEAEIRSQQVNTEKQ
ncbi:MAG: very short patch repair endonuclease [Bilifractor sp.]